MRRAALLPAAGAALVLGLDGVIAQGSWSVPVLAALDEPAHLATAALLLTALAGPGVWARRRFALAALAGSTLIDVDHVPLYLGLPVAADGGRPFTHCLLTAGVLLAASRVVRARAAVLAGLGTGVLLHLVRDVATGPGIPWAWPVPETSLLLPYPPYAAVVLAAAAVAAVRISSRSGVELPA